MMGRYNVFSGEDVPYMNTNYARICIDATMYKPIHPILWFMSDQDFLAKPIHEAYSFIDIYCYYSIHCIFLGYNLVELSSIFSRRFQTHETQKQHVLGPARPLPFFAQHKIYIQIEVLAATPQVDPGSIQGRLSMSTC